MKIEDIAKQAISEIAAQMEGIDGFDSPKKASTGAAGYSVSEGDGLNGGDGGFKGSLKGGAAANFDASTAETNILVQLTAPEDSAAAKILNADHPQASAPSSTPASEPSHAEPASAGPAKNPSSDAAKNKELTASDLDATTHSAHSAPADEPNDAFIIAEPTTNEEALPAEAIFLKNLKERIGVLFEGLSSTPLPTSKSSAEELTTLKLRLDLTTKFLEYTLANIENRLLNITK